MAWNPETLRDEIADLFEYEDVHEIQALDREREAREPRSLWSPPERPWPWRSRPRGDQREIARAQARAEREATYARALALRAEGLSYSRIAAACGISRATAFRLSARACSGAPSAPRAGRSSGARPGPRTT